MGRGGENESMPNLPAWSKLSQWRSKSRSAAKTLKFWQKFGHRRERREVKQALHHDEAESINVKKPQVDLWSID